MDKHFYYIMLTIASRDDYIDSSLYTNMTNYKCQELYKTINTMLFILELNHLSRAVGLYTRIINHRQRLN